MKASGVSEQIRLAASARSHPGMVRAENEDRHARFDSPFGEVFLVADGMGGAQAGALAAQTVVEEFQKQLTTLPAAMEQVQALKAATSFVAAKVHSIGNSGD